MGIHGIGSTLCGAVGGGALWQGFALVYDEAGHKPVTYAFWFGCAFVFLVCAAVLLVLHYKRGRVDRAAVHTTKTGDTQLDESSFEGWDEPIKNEGKFRGRRNRFRRRER